MKEKMKEVSKTLDELKLKANNYLDKRSKCMKDIAYGMLEVINAVERAISVEITDRDIQEFMKKLKYKVLLEVGIEGVMVDSELRYDGSKICGPICRGGRTNKEYYDRLKRYLVDYGYEIDKFEIILGDDIYIQ